MSTPTDGEYELTGAQRCSGEVKTHSIPPSKRIAPALSPLSSVSGHTQAPSQTPSRARLGFLQ